jgi:mono/diheme cytochrome c family protein
MDHEEQGELELTSAEREALWAWVRPEVPPDFAPRVAALAARPRARSRASAWTGVIAVAAAAVATLWLARDSSGPVDSDAPGVAATDVPTDLVRLREDVRSLLAEHCVPCHDRDAEGADEAALAVFEVTDVAWASRLSDAQLEATRERVGGMGLGDAVEVRVDRFLARERMWRAGGAG